jgi:hypothetical protein
MGGTVRAGLLCLLAVCACEGPQTAPAPDACPLTVEGRRFVTDLSMMLEKEVEYSTNLSGSDEVATWWSLAGTPGWIESTAHLASPCLGPVTSFNTTCLSEDGIQPLAPGVDACFRNECEAAGIPYADVFFTRPNHPSPDDRTTITYPSAPPYPSASVTYSPNPLTRWRYDYSQPGMATISATLARSPVVSLETGETLDLTFAGEAKGVQLGPDTSYSTSISFSRLTPRGAILMAIKNYSNAPLTGSVVLGNETLATISDQGFQWQGACASGSAEDARAD